jgi:hypothetical protein
MTAHQHRRANKAAIPGVVHPVRIRVVRRFLMSATCRRSNPLKITKDRGCGARCQVDRQVADSMRPGVSGSAQRGWAQRGGGERRVVNPGVAAVLDGQ